MNCSDKGGRNTKNINDIIKSVNGELKEKSSFSAEIYRDEPIVKPASHLDGFVPEKIREIHDMTENADYIYMSNARLFVTVGKKAEDLTDDFDRSASFFCYYPTYRDMNTDQLRTYFTWRADVRAGNIKETSLSYAFVYTYELINLIGVRSPEEGFSALKKFMLDYSFFDPVILRYYVCWLTDYAAYYDLPTEYLSSIYATDKDNALDALIKYSEKNDKELFPALVKLSSYNIEASAFFKENKEDCKRIFCAVYRAWADFYVKNRRRPLFERLFGVSVRNRHIFFDNAVFLNDRIQQDRIYNISTRYKFIFTDGKCFTENFPAGVKKSSDLGAVMRETDCIMRREFGFKKQLKESYDNKTVIKLIEKQVEDLLREKSENARKEISIDVSALDKIRRDADITRDRLITEEEKEEILTKEISPPKFETVKENSPLDETEKAFLAILLNGGDTKCFAREKGIMLSVLSDSVNEKLFDFFGDTVIDFDGDKPIIIEDYRDDVKEYI